MKWFRIIFVSIVCAIVVLLGTLYVFQESILFHPTKLDAGHQFNFQDRFEELNVKTTDGAMLNALLFKTDSVPKGVIFYLHGNAGSLDSWGQVSKLYTELGYDVFMPDPRGYGKSTGNIKSQKQLFADNEQWYQFVLSKYHNGQIIVLGYSMGSGLAAHIASVHQPKMLILQAPYYSMTDLMQRKMAFLPGFILRYPLPTFEYLEQCKMPVTVFHGDKDEVIYYGSSLKLRKHLKQNDALITLHEQGHNGITDNKWYQREIRAILK